MTDSSKWPGLPPGIESRTLKVNDLEMHIFEALPPNSPGTSAPLVILLHGFPELAYSWRKVIGPLSEAGYHVVAPDQRGYGRTKSSQTGFPIQYQDDLNPFRMTNLVRDILALVFTLGYESVAAIVGHDFGSPVAAYCALIRPDVFKSVVMMSSPFTGPPKLVLGNTTFSLDLKQLAAALAALDPPRKHYVLYYSTPDANADMMNSPGGLHAFLRAYYHAKSADWDHNEPHPLVAPPVSVMAELPHYYVMRMDQNMPESVYESRPSAEEISRNAWMTEEELGVYVAEYRRTGFQGGLNAYRMATSPTWSSDRELFSGKQIEVPAMFLAGKQDWGTYQWPGAAETMKEKACKNMNDFVLIDGAGHWVQQEQSGEVVNQLLRFFRKSAK
ncbi:Bifunctional epoxide hydrolase 2 [Mycena sanguinolenta]|uniref:Bifunctional epoxide hydrolase 2 n=1 Tax=Mycena sanguinolenta TaxID=230812 RepID=A0A8H7CV41_9AGAR|nr:Bifunctional epoxide hydrolase 2 [Mycena sanguinolenta]